MLTINADAHPLMNRMHKPDLKLATDQQEKRSVIPIEMQDVDQWLAGTVKKASALLKLAPVEVFSFGHVRSALFTTGSRPNRNSQEHAMARSAVQPWAEATDHQLP